MNSSWRGVFPPIPKKVCTACFLDLPITSFALCPGGTTSTPRSGAPTAKPRPQRGRGEGRRIRCRSCMAYERRERRKNIKNHPSKVIQDLLTERRLASDRVNEIDKKIRKAVREGEDVIRTSICNRNSQPHPLPNLF